MVATILENRLAQVLAEAVAEESSVFKAAKKCGVSHALPDWYQPALDALEAYNDELNKETNRVNY